jgi:hypothetical protein
VRRSRSAGERTARSGCLPGTAACRTRRAASPSATGPGRCATTVPPRCCICTGTGGSGWTVRPACTYRWSNGMRRCGCRACSTATRCGCACPTSTTFPGGTARPGRPIALLPRPVRRAAVNGRRAPGTTPGSPGGPLNATACLTAIPARSAAPTPNLQLGGLGAAVTQHPVAFRHRGRRLQQIQTAASDGPRLRAAGTAAIVTGHEGDL